MAPPPVEASLWSELPAMLKTYQERSDKEGDGLGRLFGYASLITDHVNEKPPASAQLPNESATLRGMEVAMNVLAAGEYEFGGTRGTYKDASGKEQTFANVGLYAGLEPAAGKDGYASGMNITSTREDRQASLEAYIKRELGSPPEGIAVSDFFDPKAAPKFEALKGTEQDKLGMYKFHVVDIDVGAGQDAKTVPAVTVSTNEASPFARIGLTPVQAAAIILDGQGYTREDGQRRARGGHSLNYFKTAVMKTAADLGLRHPRLEKIEENIEKLGEVMKQTHQFLSQSNAPTREQELNHFDPLNSTILKGAYTPLLAKGENVAKRDPVDAATQALPINKMAHTAEEKFERIAALHDQGKTSRSR